MSVKAARGASACDRLGEKLKPFAVRNQLCTYWLAGRCTRNPCRFIHAESPHCQTEKSHSLPIRRNHQKQSTTRKWRNPDYCAPKSRDAAHKKLTNDGIKCSETYDPKICNSTQKDSRTHAQPNASAHESIEINLSNVPQPKQCKYWVTGNCVHGDKCHDLHTWSYGSGFTMLAKLEGHGKAISGICLPPNHDKLYSSGNDGCLRAWDSHSGKCTGVLNVGGEVGCAISADADCSISSTSPCLFVGLHNAVKVCSPSFEFTVNGQWGLISSMVMDGDKLFAGTEDGSILVWQWKPEAIVPEPAAILKEHNGAVRSLVIGAKRLYSGSRDGTIKVWDIQNFQCLQTLHGHRRDVTAVLCWDRYLLSASLDNTIKAWAMSESGAIEVVADIHFDSEVITLCGIHDEEAKPILLCSFADYTVRLYDLPSFSDRGRIFSKREVRVIQIGIDGLFFTGDATGEITVWKWPGSQCPAAS